MLPIDKTFYSDYFEKPSSSEIYLLSKDVAGKLWDRDIYSETSCYFDLPEECWIVASQRTSLGRWIAAYNDGRYREVADLLETAMTWSKKMTVRFFVNREVIFQTAWSSFLENWDDFLTAHDDCPLVIPEADSAREAVLFTSGSLYKILR
ncbi:DUF2947 family protein [Baaleninema simplex]|uniref:DUF2947 family protein n=1 Tax=Baaleninema simplex TaxID=2862350 RepID=UPI000373A05B|nr:DUF2947 family protein [Baaleninema simplex]